MTRKQLPRAIARTNENPRQFGAGAAVDEEVQSPRSASRYDAVERSPRWRFLAVRRERSVPGSIDPCSSAGGETAVARPKNIERHKFYRRRRRPAAAADRQRRRRDRIIVRMVKRLSDLYEVPFERDRTRSFVVGVMGAPRRPVWAWRRQRRRRSPSQFQPARLSAWRCPRYRRRSDRASAWSSSNISRAARRRSALPKPIESPPSYFAAALALATMSAGVA